MRKQLSVFQELRKDCNLLESQQYEKAIENLDKILSFDPENGFAFYQKGIVYFQQDQYEKAIENFQIALSQDPNNQTILQNIGLTYKAMQQFQNSIKYFDICLQKNKDNEILLLKADSLRILGEYQESEQILIELFNKNKQNIGVLQSLLDLKLDLQQFDEAKKYIKQILVCQEPDLDILDEIAFRLISVKQQDIALQILDKILSKDKDNTEALYRKGVILYNQDKFTEAVRSFEKIVTLNEMHTSALLYLALSFGQLNRLNETVNIFGKLLKINPKDATVWNNKGIAYREMKQFNQALNCFNEALNINPKNPLYKVNKASILLETDREESLKLLQEAKNEFNGLEQDNFIYTSVNIQYMQDQFQLLDQQIENQKDDEMISMSRRMRNKTEEQQKSDILQHADYKREVSMIQQSCVIQFSNEISVVENSIVGAQIVSKGKKNSKIKYEQLTFMYQQLEQKIVEIENKIKIVGIDKRAEIYQQLDEFKKTVEGMNQLNYYRAFFWTVFNYFQSYSLQSTGLFFYSTNQTIQTTGEKVTEKIETALNIGVKLTAPLPAINSVVSAIHSAVQTLFSIHKDNKHQDRIENIQEVINNKTINLQDMELQISIAALELAIKKIDQIKNLEQPRQQTKSFINEVRKIISRMMDSKSSLYQGGAAQIGLEDALHCLGYFYQNGLIDQDEDLSQQLTNIIILKRYIVIKAEVIDDKNNQCCSNICNIQ